MVDDEPAIRELIIQVLEDEGYLVEHAANGAEALLKLQLVRPDVVVLDLMMPVIDGSAFAKACHALTTGEAIPILVTSASPELARVADQLRAYGVRARLAKPFDLDVLLAAVGRLAKRLAADGSSDAPPQRVGPSHPSASCGAEPDPACCCAAQAEPRA